MMTRTLTLATFLMFLLIGAPSAAEQAEELLIDRILAVVNDDLVMLSELRDEAEKIEERLRLKGVSPMPSTAAIQKQAFDTLVLRKLQLAEAARLGLEADEETTNRAVAAIAANNQMSAGELREALAAEGLDYETFRNSLRDEIVITRLRNREVTNRIQVTKSEIDSYLERSGGDGRTAVRLSYIMVAARDGSTPEQREASRLKAAAVVERLRAGEGFEAQAQQFSDDQTGLQGGDLGWLDVNSIPPLFQPYIAKMQKGDTEGPIASARGFHIIRLTDVRHSESKIVRQTKARHILVRTNEVTSDDEARRRLAQLRERIVNGDDFDTLARSNSDDKASAIKGGDLGWSTPGNLVPEFEQQMDKLDLNQVSQPFKTEFGWHIVQVLGRRDYDATDETRRDQARKAVRDEKAEESLEAYLRRLRDEAYIELRLDDFGA
jgi:peptidyl-prolyl cis-trans isomerase SurA